MGIRCRALALACFLGLLVAVHASTVAAATGPGFHAVYSEDGTEVWAVGDGGVFYRSFDGGATWTQGSLGTQTLRGVVVSGFTVVVVGDGGVIWRSTNSGGSWSSTLVTGSPTLRAIERWTYDPPLGVPHDDVTDLVVVGDGGLILQSGDLGATWTQMTSGTGATLYAVRAAQPRGNTCYAVGAGGTLLKGTGGFVNWSAVPSGTTNTLLAVGYSGGSPPWVVGERGTVLRDGVSVPLRMDSQGDVRAAWVSASSTVTLAGGGGFIRQTSDDAASWTFPIHTLQAKISGIFFQGSKGWVCNLSNRIVMRTTDGGATWSMPSGTVENRMWDFRLDVPLLTETRGSTFSLNRQNPNTIYCALGDRVFLTRDEGETWLGVGSYGPADAVNAFMVSTKDSTVMVAAVVAATFGAGGHIIKTTDNGRTWIPRLAHQFGEYGIPLEMHPDQPETLLFGGDADVLYRSTDFGDTWLPYSTTPLVSPCDIVVVPETGGLIVLVGDGVTEAGNGRLLQSSNGGVTFTNRQTVTGSEVPGMACSRLRPRNTFATAWASGGVRRTTDYGTNWPVVHGAGSSWGADIARDDPNCVIFGVYSGGQSYLAFDGGEGESSFLPIFLDGSNYSFFARDREVILAEQSGGLYKLRTTYAYTPSTAQVLRLTLPVGGETTTISQAFPIHWSQHSVAQVQIEIRRHPADAWEAIATVPGTDGVYAWTVTGPATTEAQIRIRDAADGSPVATSGAFTINEVTGVEGSPVAGLALSQNQPNPFVGTTRIGYALAAPDRVSLDVFDVNGKHVATLIDGRQEAGTHSVTFGPGAGRGDRLASGVYWYRLRVGSREMTRKMLLMR